MDMVIELNNSSYTFAQVVAGTGSFSVGGDTGYSGGVATLQSYLKEIGYTITDANGRYQSTTEKAVKNFQYEFGITQDGSAGPKTCLRLNTVHSSEYFNVYGKPLSESCWGQSYILTGALDDVDLLARIIYAEGKPDNTNDEKGVAIVIKNRSVNTSSQYWASAKDYPKASIYARVIGKKSQYSTANSSNTAARNPRRGYGGNEANGFIDPKWKTAVDLGKDIVNDTKISVTAYKVTGLTISTSTMTVNTTTNKDYLNQKAWKAYKADYEEGDVSSAVQPLTFATSQTCNVIYKI